MYNMLAKNWWLVALRGVLAILFGVLVFLFPALALQTLVLLFAAYALVDGVVTVWTAIQHHTEPNWWVHLLEGAVGILAGIVAITYPAITALILLYIIAAWAIFTGVFEIWAAIELRKQIENEFWLGLSGVLSILFGVVLFLFPGAGALAVLSLIAAYSVIFGVVMVVLAFRLRGTDPLLHQRHSI